MFRTHLVSLIVLWPALAGAQPLPEGFPQPLAPQEALKCIKARPGFTVELMAAEPLVQDPIAFAWGPDGKLWVVEMGDYPLGTDGKNKAGGRIKFLEKTKAGGGPYDKATTFLDNIGYPTGVTPWKKGVLVTCAPDIFYAEDADGDGKADKKVVLYTGFGEGNQQHRVNGLVWGLDNWLYGANGDSGGKIKALTPPQPPLVKGGKTPSPLVKGGESPAPPLYKGGPGGVVDIRGRDFRIKPDEGLIEAVSGQTQFGRARDDWGNWFGNNNSNPLFHFALEDRYLKRNPHLLPPDPRVQVSERPGAAPVYPISKPLPRFNNPQSVNHFTSACSAIIYRDDLFGPEYYDNSFVSEPVHNLVHREVLSPKGVTFTGKRAKDEQTSEFLAATDSWFRPAMIQTGPDGALWIADMYRLVIEHPEWIPKDWQKKLDLRAGHDKGRIYRVYPTDKKPRDMPRLDKLNVAQLVQTLDSPNGWMRDMAQQLLVAGKDKESRARLLERLQEPKNPLARLHAFCALQELGGAPQDVWLAALGDSDPALRKHAILFGEKQLFDYQSIPMRLLTKDKDPQVRMQLAYSLGSSRRAEGGNWLAELLATDGKDRYMAAAILSSVHDANWSAFARKTLTKPGLADALTLARLVSAFGTATDRAQFLLSRIGPQQGPPSAQTYVALADWLDTLEANRVTLTGLSKQAVSEEEKSWLAQVRKLLAEARVAVLNPKAALADKLPALRVLGRDPAEWDTDATLLASLLVPQNAEDLQATAVQALSKSSDPKVADLLLKNWKNASPGVRSKVVLMLLKRAEWSRSLLDAIEKKQVLPSELEVGARQQLTLHLNPEVRARAEKLLAAISSPDRTKLLQQYLLALPPKGDAELGKKLFTKHCAACHQLHGIGLQVGPDLASVPDKSAEGMLTAILDPNRAVEAKYVNYLLVTKGGLNLSGVLTGETSTSITLVSADGKKHELLRQDIDELASTGKSAMPEGFEKDLNPRDMADLLAFMRGPAIVTPKTAPKLTPGRPRP